MLDITSGLSFKSFADFTAKNIKMCFSFFRLLMFRSTDILDSLLLLHMVFPTMSCAQSLQMNA